MSRMDKRITEEDLWDGYVEERRWPPGWWVIPAVFAGIICYTFIVIQIWKAFTSAE